MRRRQFLCGLSGLLAALAAGDGMAADAKTADHAKPLDHGAGDPARLFEALRSAARQGDGRKLAAALSKNSVARLEAVRAAARLNGEADRRLSPAERLAAGALRRAVTPAELNRKNIGDLAADALSRRGAFGRDIEQATLGPVQVRGDRASAPLLAHGQPTLFTADFIREAGQWKVDLGPGIKRGDMMLMGMAMMKGGDEGLIIDSILSRIESRLRAAG